MAIVKLSDIEVQSRLPKIPGWSLSQGKLARDFQFKNFRAAFAFMTQAALISEKQDHHPEWSNVYNKVHVELRTHDCEGISERDFNWAEAINKIYDLAC